ncbi:MAG TPA: tyrosine-protein phosphatase [Sphingomonadaceae bacterium]|nr:tyrosine-protein phosphatase [Sphingomonadaceae bacterium]
MIRTFLSASILAVSLATAVPAVAEEADHIERLDSHKVVLVRTDTAPATLWLSQDTALDEQDRVIARNSTAQRVEIDLPTSEHAYVIITGNGGSHMVAGERVLPLEQGSNFRDIGGYTTADGKTVRWGKAFRTGAMPMLTEADYALLGQIDIDSIVDLRSLEERDVAPDLLDDRTGALFLSNDYSIRPLFAAWGKGNGENTYQGMEKLLKPQLRSIFKRLLAGDGAVVYHCSAGQDRTGIATALIYDFLGVDRDTILKDYHLSTQLRRPQFEMPPVDPKDYPNNPIVQYYAASKAKGEPKAEPLYTPTGQSHLAQFFTYLDGQYGGTANYLKQELGLTNADLDRLKADLLQ